MYCEQCGAKLEDGARFCAVCGAAMGSVAEPAIQVEDSFAQDQAAAPKKYRKPVMVIAAILIAIIAVIAGVKWYLESRPVTVNLDDYVTVTCSGYDTMGTAEVTIDSEAFLADYADKIEVQDEYADKAQYYMELSDDYSSAADMLINGGFLAFSLDEAESLSNGDVITVVWDAETSDAETYFNISLNYSNIEYTVSELTEIETVDIFEGVEVKFAGIAPDVSAEVVSSNQWLDASYYTLSQTAGLEENDIITISVSDSVADALLESYGITPKSQTKQVAVAGTAHYANALADITDSALAKMQSQSEDALKAYAASNWDEDASLLSMEYLGCYFLYIKDYDAWSETNYIYIVYKVNAKQQDTEHTYYWYTRFTDGIVLADGTFSIDYSDYDTPSNTFRVKTEKDGATKYLYYYGYEDLDTMFNKAVTSKIDLYTYESSVAES